MAPLVTISPTLAAELAISPGSLTLSLGAAEAVATVAVQDTGPGPTKGISLPSSFFAQQPFTRKELTVYKTEKGIKLGPVLGIMVEVPPQVMYPRDLSFYQRLINYSSSQGLLTFLFTATDLNPKEGIIIGYTGTGRLAPFPLPDVVYNRVGFLTPLTTDIFPQVYSFLTNHPRIKFYNPGGLDKWSVYSRLAGKEAAKYLPLTLRLKSYSQLASFLARWGEIYLKPLRGSHGQGIIAITRTSRDTYRWISWPAGQGRLQLSLTPEGLKALVLPLLAGGNYLAQRAIAKTCYLEDHPVDFRAHLHKDGRGQWQVAVLAAKVGPQGGATTNLHTGGYHAEAEKVLENLYADRKKIFLQRIQKLALTVAQELDDPSVCLAELGLDIAIDTKGQLWLLEANDRPGHFGSGPLQKEEKKLLKLIVEHAVFLAGLDGKTCTRAIVSRN